MELDEVATGLYAGLPADFVRRRDEAAKAAQSAGDRVLAGMIAKLRKPTVGAWLGNLLADQHPAAVAELVTLGAQLREAQTQLDAAAMRDLGRRRQELVRDLVARAKAAAADAGEPAGAVALQELEATLTAAVADPTAGQQLVEGRLTTGLTYAGFGDVTGFSVNSEPKKPVKQAAKKGTGKEAAKTNGQRDAEIDSAERDLAQARLQAAQAEADVDAATAAQLAAREALAQLQARAVALRSELEDVESAITSTEKKLAWATTERKNAKSNVTELARHVAAAERTLAQLRR